jgi:hypothetical protein
MTKAKPSTAPLAALALVAAALALMAFSARPAHAWFKSRNQAKTTGTLKVGKTVYDFSGAEISCESATGEWSIQTKGQFKDHEKGEKQVKTSSGPNLYIKIGERSCKGDAMPVESCTLQLRQEQKATGSAEAVVSVISGCQIPQPLFMCAYVLPPGNELTGANAFLKQIKSTQIQHVLLSTADVEGIHVEFCTQTNSGTFKSEEGGLIEEGLELA